MQAKYVVDSIFEIMINRIIYFTTIILLMQRRQRRNAATFLHECLAVSEIMTTFAITIYNIRYMKHIKIMDMPSCDKLIYSGGVIARQIGALMVVDDEQPLCAVSYPIVAGGQKLADG